MNGPIHVAVILNKVNILEARNSHIIQCILNYIIRVDKYNKYKYNNFDFTLQYSKNILLLHSRSMILILELCKN
jgi:hypothetical protein